MAEALDSGTGVPAPLPPEPMTIMLPAVPDSLAVVRARLREWLARAGLDSESCADVLLAVGEATANAAEHAVVAAEHAVTVVVSAALCGKLLLVTVADDGRWKPATKTPQGYRGHGMTLMNAVVDSVDLTATAGGTTVQMLKEIP